MGLGPPHATATCRQGTQGTFAACRGCITARRLNPRRVMPRPRDTASFGAAGCYCDWSAGQACARDGSVASWPGRPWSRPSQPVPSSSCGRGRRGYRVGASAWVVRPPLAGRALVWLLVQAGEHPVRAHLSGASCAGRTAAKEISFSCARAGVTRDRAERALRICVKKPCHRRNCSVAAAIYDTISRELGQLPGPGLDGV